MVVHDKIRLGVFEMSRHYSGCRPVAETPNLATSRLAYYEFPALQTATTD
jgi:hypothetical protein